MYDLIIKDVTIVNSETSFWGSVCILGEKTSKIVEGECFEKANKIIDGRGKLLFPGFIDAHVHLNDPGFTWREDFLHGTKAASIGGVTTIIDMPLQNEPALTSKEIFLSKKNHLKKKSYIDYGFYGALVNYNLDNILELDKCGVLAFKCFFAPVSPDYTPLQAGEIRQALSTLKKCNGIAAFHCEDYSIISFEQNKAISENKLSAQDFLNSRPVIAELIAVKSIIALAKEQDSKVHICHVSHPEVAEVIKKAKAEGVQITAETCPHYLIFDESDLLSKGAFFKCAPPLRSSEDKNHLWDYVIDGTIDIISSDHSPCAPNEKSVANGFFEAWGGISGIQTGFQVLFNKAISEKKMTLSNLAKVFSTNSSKIFGLSSKGDIKVGLDADYVLVDPEKKWTITEDSLEYLNKISAFLNLSGKGIAIATILRGKVIVWDSKNTSSPDYGNLIFKN